MLTDEELRRIGEDRDLKGQLARELLAARGAQAAAHQVASGDYGRVAITALQDALDIWEGAA